MTLSILSYRFVEKISNKSQGNITEYSKEEELNNMKGDSTEILNVPYIW